MRLSELVSNLTPTTYTVIGLCIFVATFVAIVARTFWPGSAEEQQRINHLPLEGDEP